MKNLFLAVLVFKISGTFLEFSDFSGLWVHGCPQGKCAAIETVEKHQSIDLKKARAGMQTTNSVGSDVCARVYGAGSLLGKASNGDGRAFCLFSDRSIIEMNSLSDYLAKKKYVR
jgi:hypothetical protein